ncbi:MAG TPA: formyltransferase family protein [Pyrinomonadaceae bacterium]|nr:formyltransferase family protein [Pyrinomonadaceae bacterium]
MSSESFSGVGAETNASKMRTLLICHDGARLDQEGLARWLASFTNLVGIVVVRETKARSWRRVRRELKRVGALRFLDVLAFRLYYRLRLAGKDIDWENTLLQRLSETYPPLNAVPTLITQTPNSEEVEKFIGSQEPDIVIARCKTLLKESVFSIPAKGTFVMHPGICPEYRNAHGCFWALANNDLDRVGMTLLRINKGVDTGPVFGYFSYPYDARSESHVVIQHRVVFENLEKIAQKFREIYGGVSTPLDVSGRSSGTWGQPWLSQYLKLRRRVTR